MDLSGWKTFYGLCKLPGLRKTLHPPPRFPQPLGRRGADHSFHRPDDDYMRTSQYGAKMPRTNTRRPMNR